MDLRLGEAGHTLCHVLCSDMSSSAFLTTTQFSECTRWTGPLAFLCTEEWMMRPVTPSTRKMPMKVRSWCTSVLSVTTASRLGFRLWEGQKSSLTTTMAPLHWEPWAVRQTWSCWPGRGIRISGQKSSLWRRVHLDCVLRPLGAVCHARCFASITSLNPMNKATIINYLHFTDEVSLTVGKQLAQVTDTVNSDSRHNPGLPAH